MSLAANSLLIHFSMLLEMKTSGNILNHVSQLLAVRCQVQVHFICFSSMRSWRDRGGFAWEGSRESFQGSLFPWFPMVELQSVSKRARECYVHWGRLRDTIIIKVFSNWLSMSTKKKNQNGHCDQPQMEIQEVSCYTELYPVVARLLGGLAWSRDF